LVLGDDILDFSGGASHMELQTARPLSYLHYTLVPTSSDAFFDAALYYSQPALSHTKRVGGCYGGSSVENPVLQASNGLKILIYFLPG
jgi:hypothetical protein